MKDFCIVIPAIKKNAVIPDQLIKKLNGITLIQRAINTALEINDTSDILIATDSEEISLIAERNNIEFYYNETLKFNSANILMKLSPILKQKANTYKNMILYRSNAPLIKSEKILKGYEKFLVNDSYVLTTVENKNKEIYENNNGTFTLKTKNFYKEIKAFQILSFEILLRGDYKFYPFVLNEEESIEIEKHQDWWICEKLLQRKRIVFNVIGSNEIGMGHIYHSLALAHEITDHEIIFVCDKQYEIAVDKIAAMDYKVIATNDVQKEIISLKPDLLINDILNTEVEFIKKIKQKGIRVVNFEDLGEGSKYTDLTINELYDIPQLEGNNNLWGYKYLFLRDEFNESKPHGFIDKVNGVLITFGGTDQNNLTLITLKNILRTCQKFDIKIYLLCGGGYRYKSDLEKFVSKYNNVDIEIFYTTNTVTKIMEKTQIAISSNGRTIYELADMNIPSIIISHHKREATHTFATLEHGFINLGVFCESTEQLIKKNFEKIVTDENYRKLLYLNIKKFSFRDNKQKIVKKIMELL